MDVFLLVPAHPGRPGERAVKWLCVCYDQAMYIIAQISVNRVSIMALAKIISVSNGFVYAFTD